MQKFKQKNKCFIIKNNNTLPQYFIKKLCNNILFFK